MDIEAELDDLLTTISVEKSVPKSEILRRSIATYVYLDRQTRDGGRKVSITNTEDKVVKDVVLP